MPEIAPKLVTNDDPNALVTCRICGEPKEARSMPGHIGGAHKIKVDAYVETYGQEAGKDMYFSGSAAKGKTKILTVEDEAIKDLTPSEKDFYEEYSQEVFGQIDRDVAQWPVVMALTLDMIALMRIRKQKDALIAPRKASEKAPDTKVFDAIVRSEKYTAERIGMQMKALGISRDEKLKNRAQIKSTPFALISGYMDELERMTPQQAESLENEERKLYDIVRERRQKYYLSVAPDLEEQSEEDESLEKLDVDALVRKANIEL